MENKLKLGDYVRYQNEYWYIKFIEQTSINLRCSMVNVKTFKHIIVSLNNIKKLSDLEISLLKHSGIIPKRNLVIRDKVKFIRDMNTTCVHGNDLNTMGFNNDDIYTVETVYRNAGKAITIRGYTFSMLEVRLVEE